MTSELEGSGASGRVAAGSPTPAVPDTTGGPVVDVLGHLRDLRQVLVPALVVGIVVALAVGALQYFVATDHQRSATASFVMTSEGASETYAKAGAGWFSALGSDTQVLAAVAEDVGGMSADDVRSAVSVEPELSPGLVTVSASDRSGDRSERLVRSMIAQMDRISMARSSAGDASGGAAAAGARLKEIDASIRTTPAEQQSRLSELYAERRTVVEQQARLAVPPLRLILLSMGYVDESRGLARPLLLGLVAGLVATVLALEALWWLAVRRGSAVSRAWARRTARSAGVPLDVGGDAGLPVSAAIEVKRSGDRGQRVIVLDGAAGDQSAESAETATIEPAVERPATAPRTFALTDRWWDSVDLGAVDLAVVLCAEGATPKADVDAALDSLAAARVPARLVLVPGGATTDAHRAA